MAVLLQLQRIFAPTRSGAIYWSLIVLQVVNALSYAVCFVLSAFPCNPREKLWNPLIAGSRVNFKAAIFATALVNLCVDIAMLLVPLFAIKQLQLARAKKLGISAIFAVGIL